MTTSREDIGQGATLTRREEARQGGDCGEAMPLPTGAVGAIAVLQAVYDELRAKAETAKAALDAAIAADAPRKIGDVVLKRGKPFSISRIGVQSGRPVYYAKQITKSGAVGTLERRLYDWDFDGQPPPSRVSETTTPVVGTDAASSQAPQDASGVSRAPLESPT